MLWYCAFYLLHRHLRRVSGEHGEIGFLWQEILGLFSFAFFFCLILILYVISRWKDVSNKSLRIQRRSLFILMGFVFVSQFFNLAISAGKPLFLNVVYVIFGIVMVILNLLVGGGKRSLRADIYQTLQEKGSSYFFYLYFCLETLQPLIEMWGQQGSLYKLMRQQ